MATHFCANNINDRISDHMHKDFITLNKNLNIGQALLSIRWSKLTGKILYVYVVNDDNQLVGVLPIRSLLTEENHAMLEKIMIPDVVKVIHTETVLDTCYKFLKHRFLGLPVVDNEDNILGVVDINLFADQFVNLAVKEDKTAYDDIFQIIGLHILDSSKMSWWTCFLDRFPWLITNIVGGIICALILGFYEVFMKDFLVLALFIPIVLSLSESVSMQSMTLALQMIHIKQRSTGQIIRAIFNDSIIALLIGLACGIVVGVISFAWKKDILVSISLLVSIMLSIFSSSLMGSILPNLVKSLKLNPKLAAGPIILTSVDVITLILFFNLSMNLLTSVVRR